MSSSSLMDSSESSIAFWTLIQACLARHFGESLQSWPFSWRHLTSFGSSSIIQIMSLRVICAGSFFMMYPPSLPRTLSSHPSFLKGTINCSKYFIEISSSLLILAREAGSFFEKVSPSLRASLTPYLSRVVSLPKNDIVIM